MQTTALFAALAAFAGSARASFSGAHYHVNYPDRFNGATNITHFQTTLVLPQTPNPPTSLVALWPGIQTHADNSSGVALVQSIAASFGANESRSGCTSDAGQWCAFTYEFLKGNPKTGPAVTVEPGAHLVIEYVQKGMDYIQTITMNGKVLSTLTDATDESAYGFYTAVECQVSFDEEVPAHQYLNTTITLAQPYPDFGSAVGIALATASPFETSDGGKTWTVATVSIEASHCDAASGSDTETPL